MALNGLGNVLMCR